MMVAISSKSRDIKNEVDPRFGRSLYFIIVDTETNQHLVYENIQNLNAVQGAGIQTAKHVSDFNVQAVITGNVGPKAFTALQAADIKIYLADISCTVEQNLERLKAGELKLAEQANQKGHWI